MSKSKRIYLCSVSWDHEIGHCEVMAYSHPEQCTHKGCGIIEAKITYVKTVRKESDEGGIPFRSMKHIQMRSIKEQIKKLEALYKKVKTEKYV